MPKKRLVGPTEDTAVWAGLAGWQATGLSLAVTASAINSGLAVLFGVVPLTPVIIALVRLRAHASTARATSDLVGSTLGGQAATFTAALQVVAYTLMAVAVAQSTGLGSSFLLHGADPAVFASWEWPLFSVAAVALAGFAAFALSDRAIGSIVAVFVGVGLLIPFYLALAVLARVYVGSEPLQMPGEGPRTGLDTMSSLLLLALTLVGFEVVTSRNQMIRSAGRPMGFAIAAPTLCAVVIWLAVIVGATGGFRMGEDQFVLVVGQFYGNAGITWLVVAGTAARSAAVLALMWAITKVVARRAERVPIGAITALSVGVSGLLIIACCRDWGSLADKLGNVAAILLVAVYVFIVEAGSRIPEDGGVAWWLRLVMPAVFVAVVLLPLLNADFATAQLWPVLITAALAALCYTVARSAPASASSSG